MKNLTKKIVAVTLLALPMAVLAVTPANQQTVNISSVGEIMGIIQSVINWVALIILTVSVFFVLMSGWTYLNSAGDPEKVNEAKDRLIYAAVGIVIGLIAFSIPNIIQNFLQ